MKSLIKSGSVAVVIAALLWSLDGVLRRHLFTLPAPVIVFWEHTFGFILLTPVLLRSLKAFRQLTRKQWLAIGGVAFLSGALATILYTAALGRVQYIPFSVVVVLQQLNPIFAIVTAGLLLKEPLTKRFFGLSAIALAAGYVVSFPDLAVNLSTGRGTLIAALMAVGAAACWGTSTAFSKYALKDNSSFHITSLRFGFTAIFAMFFVLLSGNIGKVGTITFSQFKYLLAITFSTGLVALLIYYYGLKRVMASRAAILELAWPASAVIVDYIWYGQRFTATRIIGAIILTAVIYQIARDSTKVSKAK